MRNLGNSLLTIFFLFVSVTSLAKAESPVLTIHAVNFPPYEIEKPGVDSLLGFDVEVVIEAFKRVGQRAVVDFRPWKRIVAMAKSGTTMAMLSCGKTAGREDYINYSDPISVSTRTYVASIDFAGDVPKSVEGAKGLKILAVSGYTLEKTLIAANIDYEPVVDDESALRILLRRDFDIFFSTREYVEYTAGDLGIAGKIQYFDTGEKEAFHLCFSKKWPNSEVLHDMFNKGLAEIRADGTYDTIHAKYK